MKSLLIALNLALMILLSACQVKEQQAVGNLISGHVPTTNAFTLQTPVAKTYVTGETISVVLSYPFNVNVAGSPQVILSVGGVPRTAAYVTGDGTPNLTFSYTFIAADSNAVGITSLNLNGGTLTFESATGPVNCNIASVTSRIFSGVFVDNAVPTVTAMKLTTLPGFYNRNEHLNFTVTFSEAVIVTGTPRILMDFGIGPAVYAHYIGGTGSDVLGFRIVIDNATGDTNAYDTIDPNIDLNTGTIKDAVGNNANLSIVAFTPTVRAEGALVNFDGRLPYVIAVTNPSNQTYGPAQALEFVLEFDRPVNITGSPYIAIIIGSTTRQATYLSGTGSNLIRFRYITVPGDIDTNGITVGATITQNSGAIAGTTAPTTSYFTTAANNSFSVPLTTGILVNSVQPQPVSASRNVDSTNPAWGAATPDNVWNIGQELLVSVVFNTNVFVTQTGGTPRIPLTVGATPRYATYLSGGNGQSTLIFRYVIQETDYDNDGSVAIGSIELNGGIIADAANTNTLLAIPTVSLTTTRIDGRRPTIVNVAAPANGKYSATSTPLMNFTITWSEAVNYSSASFPLDIGGTAAPANYVSGSNTINTIHRPTLTGLNDTNGIAITTPSLTGTPVIRNLAGNAATVFTFNAPNTSAVIVDNTAPVVLSVDSPAPKTYSLGETLDFVVHFDEVVNVTTAANTPRIVLPFDSGSKNAIYYSGTGTADITFRYTVVSSDNDVNGIANPTQIAAPVAGYIRDTVLNSALTYAITTDLTGVFVDALGPTIAGRTVPANGTYQDGDTLQFTVTFSEVVYVANVPRIQVAAQTGTLNFDYVSGSGSTILTFEYTVTANDFDFDGLPTSINTIQLNGGTIKDTSLNNSTLTFTAANLSAVYIAYPNIRVWSTNVFSNRSAIPGISVTSGGAATTTACAPGTCRLFNGDDSFNLSAPISNVEEIFVVFKTSGTLANLDMISTEISLVNDGTNFDLTTLGSTINLDGVTASGTSFNVNMPRSTVHILHSVLNTPASYGAGALINTTFRGGIGDVILVTGTLTPTQRAAILTYLNLKY